MLFTWFMLTGSIFLFAPQNLTSKFQLAFVHVFRWPLSIVSNLLMTTQTQQPLTGAVNRSETKYLNYIAFLEETLAQERKNFKKLSELYNTHVWKGVDFVLADVTATVKGLRNELTINCRENVGLVQGQFVLGDNSIIGTISDVSSRTASVKLFTDPASSIAVKIGKLDLKKMWMQGNGNNTAKIPLVSIEHKIKKDDNVFARKKAGFLDAPVIIGRVAQLKRDDKNPLLWDITVEPACDIEQLEDVAVIIMNPQK